MNISTILKMNLREKYSMHQLIALSLVAGA